jgi:hypothetical protein
MMKPTHRGWAPSRRDLGHQDQDRIPFPGNPLLRKPALQADVTNLADKTHYSASDSDGFTASDTGCTTPSLLLGASRQFFVSVKGQC